MLSNGQKRQYIPRYKPALIIWSFSFLLCGLYFFGAMARSGVAFELLASIPKMLVLLWKGLAEALLVLACLLVARSFKAFKLVLYVFLIFIADMALALGAVPVAGLIFALAHLFAAYVYLGISLKPVKPFLKLISLMPISLVFMVLIYSISVSSFQIIVIFPIFSALTTFGALRSDYPWFLNGIGAALIWVSDMLFVFAILTWGDATAIGWLVWLTFSSGFLLVVLGLIKNHIQISDV